MGTEADYLLAGPGQRESQSRRSAVLTEEVCLIGLKPWLNRDEFALILQTQPSRSWDSPHPFGHLTLRNSIRARVAHRRGLHLDSALDSDSNPRIKIFLP